MLLRNSNRPKAKRANADFAGQSLNGKRGADPPKRKGRLAAASSVGSVADSAYRANGHAQEQSRNGNQPRSAFTIINAVRDRCQQAPAARHLLLVLATYCDLRSGICWPSNDRLMSVTGMSRSAVQRALRRLVKTGDIQMLRSGAGRSQRRKISLGEYVKAGFTLTGKGVTSDTFKHVAS